MSDNIVDLDEERFMRKALPLVLEARRRGFLVSQYCFEALSRAEARFKAEQRQAADAQD